MQPGKLITLEGIEGVGKSSNLRFMADYLTEKGLFVCTTREPGGTPLAEDLRKILLYEYEEKTQAQTELLILYAGRIQHLECIIKPALVQGKWVICDRFNDATFAYQGAGRGINEEEIEKLDQWALKGFCPSLTIILDAPVEIAFSRIQQNRDLDRFEREKRVFFERIREAYLTRAAQVPARYHVVDASRTLSEVQKDLRDLLDKFIQAN